MKTRRILEYKLKLSKVFAVVLVLLTFKAEAQTPSVTLLKDSTSPWNVPTGVSKALVYCWGPGGSGNRSSNFRKVLGGGGGAFAGGLIKVSGTIPFVVGLPSSYQISTYTSFNLGVTDNQIKAAGGSTSGSIGGVAYGGSASSCIGTIKYSGGNGNALYNNYSYAYTAGGGCAGPRGNGSDGTTSLSGNTSGGAGGAGGGGNGAFFNSSNKLTNAQVPGGGGASYSDATGYPITSAGAPGQIVIYYPTITALSASSGCSTATLTITGTNLTGAVASDITIGGVAVTKISSQSETKLVVVPAAGSSGTVSVTSTYGTFADDTYSYTVNSNPSSGGTIGGAQSGSSGFDPDAFTSSASASGQVGSLEYQWQSSTISDSEGFSDIASCNAATYDPGDLTATTWFKRLARVSCQSDWANAVASNVLKVTVKITPSISTAPSSSSITYGQTLASSTLSDGVASVEGTFAFTEPATAPNAGTALQYYTFTPTDSTNYTTVTGTVSVTVTKATPSITTVPTASDITYGQTLASSTLSDGIASVEGTFAFTEPATAPNAGTALQYYTFTPTDITNYNTVIGTVGVTVAKATPTITTVPTASDLTYNQTLASSTLSGGIASVAGTFAFTTSSTTPGAGTANQGYTFTPIDAFKYNTVTGTVSVTVNKATPTITSAPTASTITYGQTLASSTLNDGVASVLGTFAFTTPSTTPSAGTANQGYTFTPADTNNYVSVTGRVSVTVTSTTKVLDSECGTTLAALNTSISCYPIANATAYKFKIVTAGTKATRYFSSTTNSFNLNQVAGSLYNTSYTISVAATIQGTLKAYGSACTVTTPVVPLTKVQPTQCGATLTYVNTGIYANAVLGATSYRFKVVNGSTTETIETRSRYFYLTSLPGGTFHNTEYTISVATNINGVWGEYGDKCEVRTPSGLTKILTAQCDKTLAYVNTAIYANAVTAATNYRFKVVNGTTTEIIETQGRSFNLTSLQGGTFHNTAYRISVATKYNDKWGEYGDECEVRTPSGLTKIQDSQCRTALASLSTPIYANAVTEATSYRFKVVANGVTRTLESASRYFRLTSLTDGASYNTTYTINVATKYNDKWGEFGDDCFVATPFRTVPSTAKQASAKSSIGIVPSTVLVVAYPNPCTANFKFDFSSPSASDVVILVYDMAGNRIESRKVSRAAMNNLELGSNYPSGVYNVIVTQGEEIKTLRVIKK